MPHIRVRALDKKVVAKLSQEIPLRLAEVLITSVGNFTVERVATEFYKDGVLFEGEPMVEVYWFERGPEIKRACARILTEWVQEHDDAKFVSVVFFSIPRESYLENGQHF